MREFVGKFQNAENIIIAFPLYVDSMPALVKDFFENLDNVKLYPSKQKIGFFIHCGFPDAIQLRSIEKHLGKHFRSTGEFDHEILKTIALGEKFSPLILPLLKLLNHIGLFNIMWNKQLKKNNAYKDRFAKPYINKKLTL